MSTYNVDEIARLLRAAVGGVAMPVRYVDVTVDSVDEVNKTCRVSSCDGSQEIDELEVRYLAETSDGDEDVPEVNSTCVIVFTEITDPVIVSKSWLTKKLIVVGDQSYEIKDGSQKFNGGEFGGLAKVKDTADPTVGLLKKINVLEEILNDLQAKFTAWVVVPSDGGLALKTLLTVTPPIWNVPNIVPTTESEISNSKITHGA